MARRSLACARHPQFRYLVEEQCAAVACSNLATGAAHARRRALFDGEEFGLYEGLDQGGAVDRNKGTMVPPAQPADLTGDEFLAGAAFALDPTVVGRS
jgi:hypothetical protein